MKLNVGSGAKKLDGYLSIDIDPANRPDIVGDITNIPLKDESVQSIEAWHVIEHLYPWEAQQFVAECERILRQDGTIGIECPNLSKVVDWLAANRNYSWFSPYGVGRIYGNGRQNNVYMMHKWGYTADTLRSFLEWMGFAACREEKPLSHFPEMDLRVTGVKTGGREVAKVPGLRDVFWLLYADDKVASSRVHGRDIHRELLENGIRSEILLDPPFVISDVPWTHFQSAEMAQIVSGGIVVIQKLQGRNTEELVGFCSDAGATTVYVACDYDMDNTLPFLCDYVVCPSQVLVNMYREHGCERVHYIPDYYELAVNRERSEGPDTDVRKLNAVWLGEAGHWNSVQGLRELIQQKSDVWELITLSNHPDADLGWSTRNLESLLQMADVAVIPTERGLYWESKSSNRLVTFMASGVPTIAGPIPAYTEIIDHGVNGYIAADWNAIGSCLNELSDPATRRRIGVAAKASVETSYAKERIAGMWRQFLGHVEKGEPWKTALSQRRESERRRSRLRMKTISELAFALDAYNRGLYSIAYRKSKAVMDFHRLNKSERPIAQRLVKKLTYGMMRRSIGMLARKAARRV